MGDLLTLAVVEPMLGCRQYAARLVERGYQIGKTTAQIHLIDHGLGRRAQRFARAAAITAERTGLSTDAIRDNEPFGIYHNSPPLGHLGPPRVEAASGLACPAGLPEHDPRLESAASRAGIAGLNVSSWS